MSSRTKKLTISKANLVVILLILVVILSIVSTSWARFNNRVVINSTEVWDGSIADSYRFGDGSVSNPYVIANGAEFAYFAKMLETTDYADTYFILKNDIILNQGILNYDEENGGQYLINNTTYYLKEGTNEYYLDSNYTTLAGYVNKLNALKNFKGHLDGKYFRIYGLYLSDNEAVNLGLFSELDGVVKNLYIENALINGGYNTGMLAASAINAKVENVLVNGYLISNQQENIMTKNILLDDIEVANGKKIELSSLLPIINGKILKIELKGHLENALQDDVSINGKIINNGDFTLDLGTEIINELNIIASSEGALLSKLEYVIEYKNNVAGGIVGSASNSEFNNVVNKSTIIGSDIVGGILGFNNNTLNINTSYNNGTVKTNRVGGGIVGSISSNSQVNLNKVYNNGSSKASFVYEMNNGAVTLNDSFDLSNNNYLFGFINTYLYVNNSYFVSDNVNSEEYYQLIKTDYNQLISKEFLQTTFGFKEYVDLVNLNTNKDAIWVMEEDLAPILYIDDLNSAVASININNYSWNNFSKDVSNLEFANAIAYNIQGVDELNPLKEISYYVSDQILSLDDLNSLSNWQEYSEVQTLDEEGKYIIYARVVDYNDNVSYLNSDALIIDYSAWNVKVKVNNKVWETFHNNIGEFNIGSDAKLEVELVDDLANFKEISYYISETELDANALNNLKSTSWIQYNAPVVIKPTKAVIYVKVVDNLDRVTYVNTDYIVYDGYQIRNLSAGRNKQMDLMNLNINENSSFSFEIEYSTNKSYEDNVKRFLISNQVLPLGTKFILIDKNTNKTYKYKVDSDALEIDLELFKEVGSIDKYLNLANALEINENWYLTVDFSEVAIEQPINNLNLKMEMRSNDVVIVPTVDSSYKVVNVYTDRNSGINISSNYTGEGINYSSDSTTDIMLNTAFNYQSDISGTIYDTVNEDMNLGVILELVDSQGLRVKRTDLANLQFLVNDVNYYPNSEGLIYINEDMQNGVLRVITSKSNKANLSGEYKLKISSCLAYSEGKCLMTSENVVEVPVIAKEEVKYDYGFDVIMADSLRVLKKDNAVKDLEFKIKKSGEIVDANIRVKFYKKNIESAYDQSYTLIDLKDYSNIQLMGVGGMSYFVTVNPIDYNGSVESYNMLNVGLDTNRLDYGAYKFVFELFSGDEKIADVTKTLILK